MIETQSLQGQVVSIAIGIVALAIFFIVLRGCLSTGLNPIEYITEKFKELIN